METQQIIKLKSDFDKIVHNEDGVEYWLARELQTVLGYKTWENFYEAIIRAQTACKNSGKNIEDHFRETTKLTVIGRGGHRNVVDFALTRYACYLTAQNGDPGVVVDISAGITYNISMIKTPPRLSTMRTMAGSPFLEKI